MAVTTYTFARIAGGCGCRRKAASVTRCRRTTSSSSSSMNTLLRSASAITTRLPSSVRPAGSTGMLTDRPMHRVDAYEMVHRRTAEAGFKGKLGCRVFRATGITAYLEAGGTLENAQAMARTKAPAPSSRTIAPATRGFAFDLGLRQAPRRPERTQPAAVPIEELAPWASAIVCGGSETVAGGVGGFEQLTQGSAKPIEAHDAERIAIAGTIERGLKARRSKVQPEMPSSNKRNRRPYAGAGLRFEVLISGRDAGVTEQLGSSCRPSNEQSVDGGAETGAARMQPASLECQLHFCRVLTVSHSSSNSSLSAAAPGKNERGASADRRCLRARRTQTSGVRFTAFTAAID
jgi:hypothetical protein